MVLKGLSSFRSLSRLSAVEGKRKYPCQARRQVRLQTKAMQDSCKELSGTFVLVSLVKSSG